MKVLIVFVLSLAAFGQAKPAPKPAAKTAAATYPKEVPKDAKRLSNHEWRWVDKDGKAWIFRQTPFGVAKFAEELAASETAPSQDAGAPLSVRDMGDSVEFTRKTPFGVNTWMKKKSELSDVEKSAWESATKKQERE